MTPYRCPRCQVQLERKEMDGITVEYCLQCSGLCLDGGELDRIAEETPGSLEYSMTSVTSLAPDDGHPTIACLKCDTPKRMRKIELLHHTGIVLDRCEACGVLWLDMGELDAINTHIQRLNRSEAELSFWLKLQIFAVNIASAGV